MSGKKEQQNDYPEESEHDQEKKSNESGNEVEKGEEAHHDAPADKKKISIGSIVFLFLFIASFAFCAGAIAIGMADSKHDSSCLSMWGWKPNCNKTWFRKYNFDRYLQTVTGEPWRKCDKASQLMNGAQAFSVMCVIGTFLTSLCGVLEVLQYAELAVVACIMGSITCVATLISWTTMVAFWMNDMCGAGKFKDDYNMGVGLILFITAFCVEFVAIIVLVIAIALGDAK